MADDFTRRSYGPDRFSLPRDGLPPTMGHIKQAIDGRPDGKKPFIILYGPPGAGKSWLLAQIREKCQELGVRCSEIVQAQELLNDPEARLIALLRFCLDDQNVTVSGTQPDEITQELANKLDGALRNQTQPIALFFDDLDYWVNWGQGDPHRPRIYQQLWWTLLRSTQLPGLVICTSREPLPNARFTPGMKRKLELVKVEPAQNEIDKLVDGILSERPTALHNPSAINVQQLKELARRYACGHPLVVDWLVWKLDQDSRAFEDANRQNSLRELAGVLIGGRLDTSDEELLIHLARNFPDGFADAHSILGSGGPDLVRRLKQIGLVDKIPNKSTYQVLPPLACLYLKEGSNG